MPLNRTRAAALIKRVVLKYNDPDLGEQEFWVKYYPNKLTQDSIDRLDKTDDNAMVGAMVSLIADWDIEDYVFDEDGVAINDAEGKPVLERLPVSFATLKTLGLGVMGEILRAIREDMTVSPL